MKKISSFFFISFLILMFSPTFESFPTANLSTTWTANNLVVQPILLSEANGAQFGCGFFCEENCTSYFFAILISPATDRGKYRAVWSANTDHPVSYNAILNFTAAGNLVLHDVDRSIVWTTNTEGKSVVGMNLTDTGNLVLFDDRKSVIWQSFDHPTNSLLPGQKLFTGQKLRSTVSLTNSSEGMYSLQVTDKGVFAYVESNPPQAYYSMFNYSKDTNEGRKYIRFLNGSLSLFMMHSSEPSDPDPYNVIPIPQASSTPYMKLLPDGHLKVFEWKGLDDPSTLVDLTETFFHDDCSYPLACGRNSICSTNIQCSCPSLEYFRPVDERKPGLGCSEITPLTCNSTQDQHFISVENVRYFAINADMDGVNMETCKQACLNNCSCKAAFFQYDSNASSGNCFLPSDIFTMKTIDPHDINALAFIKVQNVTSHRSSLKVVFEYNT